MTDILKSLDAPENPNIPALRPGDVVRVTGAPGRNPEDHRMVLRYLIRPSDGFTYGDKPEETFD